MKQRTLRITVYSDEDYFDVFRDAGIEMWKYIKDEKPDTILEMGISEVIINPPL